MQTDWPGTLTDSDRPKLENEWLQGLIMWLYEAFYAFYNIMMVEWVHYRLISVNVYNNVETLRFRFVTYARNESQILLSSHPNIKPKKDHCTLSARTKHKLHCFSPPYIYTDLSWHMVISGWWPWQIARVIYLSPGLMGYMPTAKAAGKIMKYFKIVILKTYVVITYHQLRALLC